MSKKLIGTEPNQVPLNGMLGTLAFQDSAAVSVGDLNYFGNIIGGTGVFNLGQGQVYKDATGNVGLGTTTPQKLLHLSSATNGATIRIQADNGGTIAGDIQGAVEFYNNDASAGTQRFTAAIKTLNTEAVFGRYGRLGIFTASGALSEEERLSIDNAGNVGIGTTAPARILHVLSSTTASAGLFESTTGTTVAVGLKNTGSTALFPQILGVNDNFAVQTGGSTRLTVDSTGNVGIGTAAPGVKLEVVGAQANWRKISTDTTPFYSAVVKARGAVGAPTTVVLGDAIAAYQFYCYNGTNEQQAATIIGRVAYAGTVSATSMPGALEFFTTPDGSNSPVSRMYLDASGNLGIGYTTGLPIATTGGSASAGIFAARSQLLSHQTSMGVLQFATSDNLTQIRSYGSAAGTGQIAFQVGGGGGSADSEAVRINVSGNVGIGTSSPTAKLVVSNAGAQGFEFDPFTGIFQVYNRSTLAYGEMRPYASQFRFFSGATPTETMRLDASGNVTPGATNTQTLGSSSLIWSQVHTGALSTKSVYEALSSITTATGVVVHNVANGQIFNHTSISASFTANFTNLGLAAGFTTGVVLVLNQGATAYIPSAVQIAGVAQTINWQGGTAPTGNANKKDVVSFSFTNIGGTYTVLGQLVSFG